LLRWGLVCPTRGTAEEGRNTSCTRV